MTSSAAARPMSGRDPAPSPWVMLRPSCRRRSQIDCASAWASVFDTMNSTPSKFDRIMLLTAFPPAPPTPTTVMRGLISYALAFLGIDRFNVILEPPILVFDVQGYGCGGGVSGAAFPCHAREGGHPGQATIACVDGFPLSRE